MTSRYEENEVLELCHALGLRLVPKVTAPFVPLLKISGQTTAKRKIDAILLDDDELVHLTWTSIARENQRSFMSFYEPDEFMAALHDLDTTTPVFIDSQLRRNFKGQNLISKVSALGFTNISIATGSETSEFKEFARLVKIVGKGPPQELFSPINI